MSVIRIYRRNWGEEKTDWSIGIPSLSSLLCAKHGANLTKKAGQVALLSFKHTIPFFISDYLVSNLLFFYNMNPFIKCCFSCLFYGAASDKFFYFLILCKL